MSCGTERSSRVRTSSTIRTATLCPICSIIWNVAKDSGKRPLRRNKHRTGGAARGRSILKRCYPERYRHEDADLGLFVDQGEGRLGTAFTAGCAGLATGP